MRLAWRWPFWPGLGFGPIPRSSKLRVLPQVLPSWTMARRPLRHHRRIHTAGFLALALGPSPVPAREQEGRGFPVAPEQHPGRGLPDAVPRSRVSSTGRGQGLPAQRDRCRVPPFRRPAVRNGQGQVGNARGLRCRDTVTVMVVMRGPSSVRRSRILDARPSPWGHPLLIQQVWPAQIPDHQPNRFSRVPGKLIAPGSDRVRVAGPATRSRPNAG